MHQKPKPNLWKEYLEKEKLHTTQRSKTRTLNPFQGTTIFTVCQLFHETILIPPFFRRLYHTHHYFLLQIYSWYLRTKFSSVIWIAYVDHDPLNVDQEPLLSPTQLTSCQRCQNQRVLMYFWKFILLPFVTSISEMRWFVLVLSCPNSS